MEISNEVVIIASLIMFGLNLWVMYIIIKYGSKAGTQYLYKELVRSNYLKSIELQKKGIVDDEIQNAIKEHKEALTDAAVVKLQNELDSNKIKYDEYIKRKKEIIEAQ